MERGLSLVICAAILLAVSGTTASASSPTLGSANNFAVLASSTVTSTGATVINGDVGLSPGTSITGFPPGIVAPPSTEYAADTVSQVAETDASSAYNELTAEPATENLTGQNLGGLTLMPGVYSFNSSGQLTGKLTLDGNGDPNTDFVFQFGSTLTTASSSSVVLEDSANAENVFWAVGSSATLGTDTAFTGNVIANTSVTMDTGSSLLDGRAIALNGAVTLDDNAISIPVGPAPEMSGIYGTSVALMGLLGMAVFSRKRRSAQ